MTVLTVLACTADPVEPPKPIPPGRDTIEAPPPAPRVELGPAPTRDALPDIVLVSIDTLRPDHLGTYGYNRPTSPFIDGLAAKGVRFAHARSPSPWTLPAHTTMFTGQLPTTHLVVEDNLRLADTVPVLPDLLRQQGYATAGAVGTLFVSSMYGFHRGFVHFDDFGVHDKKSNLQGQTSTPAIVDALLPRLDSDRPLFLFLHTYDAHYAYDPPEPYASMFDRAPDPSDIRYRSYAHYKKNPLPKAQLDHQIAQYDESIRSIDAELARLDAALKQAGRKVRWMITSDHGEEFGERGSWGHGHTLYAEQLRIPLIVSGQGIPSGIVVEEPVGTQDIAVTLSSWAGVSEGLRRPDGIDLTPFLSGDEAPPARAFLAETSRHRTLRLALFEDGRRLEWNVASGEREVFTDPEETRAGKDDGALRSRTLELLGTPWTAAAAGVVETGRRGRVLLRQARRSQTVEAGTQFQVFPLDAEVRFHRNRKADRASAPISQAAGRNPVRPPLRWEGGDRAVPVDLSADTKAALESLGYVQD